MTEHTMELFKGERMRCCACYQLVKGPCETVQIVAADPADNSIIPPCGCKHPERGICAASGETAKKEN